MFAHNGLLDPLLTSSDDRKNYLVTVPAIVISRLETFTITGRVTACRRTFSICNSVFDGLNVQLVKLFVKWKNAKWLVSIAGCRSGEEYALIGRWMGAEHNTNLHTLQQDLNLKN